MRVGDVLDDLTAGRISRDRAEEVLGGWGFVQIGYHRIDLRRETRTSIPEVVLGLSKSVEQIEDIVTWFEARSLPLLATKVAPEKGDPIAARHPEIEYRREAGLLMLGRSRRRAAGTVGLITAGSSDIPVAEEAAGTLEFFGLDVLKAYDCGVAGLHRLLAAGETIAKADILVVVAGMEGALPSVVAGLFRQPVIAVPTSVGYGASFEGLSALLGMLNSCAPGVVVVNIDNGFGA
ncbi:MAG: nickel pincer cofactor biosynthesis protein LarB, partial [Thermoanaerobaculia bacterium]